MIIKKLIKLTTVVITDALLRLPKRNRSLSTLLAWLTPPTSEARLCKPSSGINWSTMITNPTAEMKPRRNGLERTESRNPNRVNPAIKMVAPAIPVTTPATLA